ncbi:ATP-dependent DNA helicase RecQ-like isoform X1 [Cucumis melo var. makuwa]|uniref:ATP-dependent DNA helicase RecQ-like isoform X1 n=1 Tax=Cucumis melo var. makuwa TaxID=1194695 RepID=A0A5D3BT06_CUCMM|nr:ATP-dependent DNA helicase RecQ-like isoform X1 [Cucumis melo var. makuwa]
MRRDRDGFGRSFNGRGRGGDHDCGRHRVGCRDEEEKWVSTTKLFIVMDKIWLRHPRSCPLFLSQFRDGRSGFNGSTSRVEYKQLDKRHDVLPGLPFVALTATTTEKYR